MDLGSTLVGLATLLVFMGPVLWLQWSGKSKREKRSKTFRSQALALGIDLEKMNTWSSNYCIGIGNAGRALLYYNERQTGDQFKWIDLTNVVSCKLHVESRKLTREGETITVVDRISMRFETRSGKMPVQSIVLFDSDQDPSISDQLNLAKEWESTISAALRIPSPVVRRAKAA